MPTTDIRPTQKHRVPTRGAHNPGSTPATTPGSFANPPDIGGPLAFSSPDTPGMPAPSTKTAWDFLPEGWIMEARRHEGTEARSATSPVGGEGRSERASAPSPLGGEGRGEGSSTASEASRLIYTFTDSRNITRRITVPTGFQPVTQLEHARLGLITPAMRRVAEREAHLTPEQVRDEVAAGRMIIPANIHHLAGRLDPMCIGRASKTKINANMGASPVSSGTPEELEKLRWALRWGADTVMDLSTGGDLDACREAIINESTAPIGTVPIYSMIIERKLEDLDERVVMETLEKQAKQGVDYFTIHAGIRWAHLKFVKQRRIGIVSRGGSLLAKWMLTHSRENLMYDMWDDICRLMREHDVSFSIGDGLRPGGLADATDDAQLAELETIGELTERAWRCGVQVMVEGPGHVPFDQIEFNMKLERTLCHGAPFYVLGPLVTDIFPGYDHITSCIGATAAAYHGASMLCYVTPKEHLGLPKKDDVKQGCIAYKIAAHAADVALGIPGARDRDDALTDARAALNWEKHFELSFDPDYARALHDEDLDVDTDFCAMCGHDWCSVRISKEIQDFASGKAEGFERDKPVRSAALTPEQQAVLETRGYLKPEEIHRLASKTKKKMAPPPSPPGGEGRGEGSSSLLGKEGRGEGSSAPSPLGGEGRGEGAESKPVCHSDFVDAEEARELQEAKLVQLNTLPAHGIGKEDRVV